MPCCKYLFALLLLFIISSVHATTRIVDINGSGQYTSIQTAINASSPGDTVLVYPGRYYENIVIQTDNLSLISLEFTIGNPEYVGTTIIDGGLNAQGIRLLTNTQNCLIRGFSITNSKNRDLFGRVQLFSYHQLPRLWQ